MKFNLVGGILVSGLALAAAACSPSTGNESSKFSFGCEKGNKDPSCKSSNSQTGSGVGTRRGELYDQDGDGKFGMYCKGTETEPTVSTEVVYNEAMARAMIERKVEEEEEKLKKSGTASLGFSIDCSTTRNGGYECSAFKYYEREGWDKEVIRATAVRDEQSKAEALELANKRLAELKADGIDAVLIGPSPLPERDRNASDRAASIAVATILFPGCND